jgi:hypothetical protein
MIAISNCAHCAMFTMDRQCLAFRGDIPNDIWSGELEHRISVSGDRGIVFSPMDDSSTAKSVVHPMRPNHNDV